jgi:hypothetical protein
MPNVVWMDKALNCIFFLNNQFIISSITKTEFSIMKRTTEHHKYTFVSMSPLPNLANLRRASVCWIPNNTGDREQAREGSGEARSVSRLSS